AGGADARGHQGDATLTHGNEAVEQVRRAVMQLADTTAWHLSRRVAELRAPFDRRTLGRVIGTCSMVTLELLQSARNGQEFDARRMQVAELPQCPIAAKEWARAI